jgi:hypothetical protein
VKKVILLEALFLVINYMFILSVWQNALGSTLGFIFDSVFVLISVFIVYSYVKPVKEKNKYEDEDEDDNNLQSFSHLEELELQTLAKSIKEMFKNEDHIDIQNLSLFWQNNDVSAIKKGLLSATNESFDVDFSVVKKSWRSDNDVEDPNMPAFKSNAVKGFYRDFSKSLAERNIKYDNELDAFVFYLLSIIDKYGDSPSVVDLKNISKDPDDLKRNVMIGNFNFYNLLRSNITLKKHALATANQILFNKIDLSSLTRLDNLDFLFAIIAALAHDIGKISEMNSEVLSHPLASSEILKAYIEETNLKKNYPEQIENLLEAVEKHHEEVSSYKNNELINQKEKFNAIFWLLKQADVQERKEEKEEIIKSMGISFEQPNSRQNSKNNEGTDDAGVKTNSNGLVENIDDKMSKLKDKIGKGIF